jgi:hypothetical protein
VQFTTYEQLKKVNPSFWSFVVWMLTRWNSCSPTMGRRSSILQRGLQQER